LTTVGFLGRGENFKEEGRVGVSCWNCSFPVLKMVLEGELVPEREEKEATLPYFNKIKNS